MFAFQLFYGLPVVVGLAVTLGLDQGTTTAWIFGAFITAALSTVPLAIAFREPYLVTSSGPAAVMLASAGAHYGWPAILGVCAVTGLLIIVGGIFGLGRLSMRLVPLPLVMGLFAGSVLRLATDAFAQLASADAFPPLAAIAGFFLTRLAFQERVPSTLGALALGFLATVLSGHAPSGLPLEITGPHLAVPELNLSAIITLSVPTLILVVGTGNVQALGFMRSQGYRPRADLVTVVVGAATFVGALLGTSPAGVARQGVAIVGGPEAGPREVRWAAAVFSTVLIGLIAFLSVPATALAFALPKGFVATVAGLAIVTSLLDALRIAFTSRLAYSSFFALVISFTPFAPLGLEAAFWGLVGGMVIAFLFERDALFQELRGEAAPPGPGR